MKSITSHALGSLLAVTASSLSVVKSSITGPVVGVPRNRLVVDQSDVDQMNSDFPDPSIIQVGDIWYAFGTQSKYDNINVKVQLATSTNFKDWSLRYGYDALGSIPKWVLSSHPQVWAPDVMQMDDGSFVMYFSATAANSTAHHCFGAATSQSVEGPYIPSSDIPFTCPLGLGGVIDASGFQDRNGDRYVTYKIDGNSLECGEARKNGAAPCMSTPIMIQKVGPDGITHIGGATQILDRDSGDGLLVEAPSMALVPGGTYVLFFSSGRYTDGSYDTSYATASCPTGPFKKTRTPLLVTGKEGLYGPGGADIALDASHIAFHAYRSKAGEGGRRYMYTSIINWASNSRTHDLS